MQTISMAAQRIITDKVPVMVAGGVESISLVQNNREHATHFTEDWLMQAQIRPCGCQHDRHRRHRWRRAIGIGREAQDEYALSSQTRTAAAQAGRPASTTRSRRWTTVKLR